MPGRRSARTILSWTPYLAALAQPQLPSDYVSKAGIACERLLEVGYVHACKTSVRRHREGRQVCLSKARSRRELCGKLQLRTAAAAARRSTAGLRMPSDLSSRMLCLAAPARPQLSSPHGFKAGVWFPSRMQYWSCWSSCSSVAVFNQGSSQQVSWKRICLGLQGEC